MAEYLRLCGRIDVEPVLAALPRYAAEFDEATWRDRAPGSPHQHTKTLFLRMPGSLVDPDPAFPFDRLTHEVFHSLDVVDLPAMDEAAFRVAVEDVCRLVGQTAARAMIVKLAPSGFIAPHVDQGTYAEATSRYHLCLETNGWARMLVGFQSVHASPGECWWFDKHSSHCVINLGNTWRTHLIVDCWRSK